MTAPQPVIEEYWNVEAAIAVPGITIQVGGYDWVQSHEIIQRPENHTLALLLSPRHAYSQGYFIAPDYPAQFRDIGEMLLTSARIPLQARASGGPIRFVRSSFAPDRFEALTGLGNDWETVRLKACLDIRQARIQETLLRLAHEVLAPGFGSPVLAEALAMSAAVELARYLRSFDIEAETDNRGLTPWQLKRIANYVANQSGPLPEIADLAALCGISPRHLRRLFKNSRKQTVQAYLRDLWVARAKALLCDTDLPLKEISSQLGFGDPSSFSVSFRRATGELPRTFRQQFAKESVIRQGGGQGSAAGA